MMTDDQLNAIEARADVASIAINHVEQVKTDIPALVAEVRRLRGQVDAVSEAFANWESVRTVRNDINSHEWLALVGAMVSLEGESEGA